MNDSYTTSESGIPLQVINFCVFAAEGMKNSDISDAIEEQGLLVATVEKAKGNRHYHLQIDRNEGMSFEEIEELLVELVFKTQSKEITISARRINYCDGAYICSARLTGESEIVLGEWTRLPPTREKLGASPLTRNQMGASRTILAHRKPTALEIPAHSGCAKRIKTTLNKTIPNDVTEGMIKTILEQINVTESGGYPLSQVSQKITEQVGLPIELTRVVCEGSIPIRGEPMEWVSYIENSRYDIETTPDLSGSPGFQRLVRDCIRSLGREKATMQDAKAAYQAMLTTVVDLGKQINDNEDFPSEWDLRMADVLWTCKNLLQRSKVNKNMSVIGEFYAQLPPHVVLEICNNFIDIYEAYGEDKDQVPFDLTNADMVATEPFHASRKGIYHGIRWRRLNSPQHQNYAHRTNQATHNYVWVRCADLNNEDIDFLAFGIPGNVTNNQYLKRSTSDYAVQAWMIGLGPTPWNVAPMAMLILERDNTNTEEMRWKIYSANLRMGATAFPQNCFADEMLLSLKAVLATEMNYEWAWKNEDPSFRRLILMAPDLQEGDDAYDEVAFSLALHAAGLKGYGGIDISFEGYPSGFDKECDKQVTSKEAEEARESYHSSIKIIMNVNDDAWGIIAVEREGHPCYIQIPEPNDNRHFKKAIKTFRAYTGKFEIDCNDIEAITEATYYIEGGYENEEVLAPIQAAMSMWGRVIFTRYDTVETTGIKILSTPPGTTPLGIMTAAITDRKIGEYDHVYSIKEIEEINNESQLGFEE